MELALKERCVPKLRAQCFKGSFPNFYRKNDGFVALINFQFNKYGGSFCVNLSYAGPHRENVVFVPEVEDRRLHVNATKVRQRLGAEDGGDKWFHFGETRYGSVSGRSREVDEIADICAQLLLSEAEDWWRAKRQSF